MNAGTSQPSAEDPRDWGRAEEMTAFEALMWRAEEDPVLRSHMTAIEVLDCVPDWDRLVRAHEWATRVVPRFRERVVEPLLNLGPPIWAVDGNFDLTYHLRRVSLPAPGGLRQLLDFVQATAMAPLDPTRPQWEAVLVEGLEGDRSAYVLKMNHALTDGLGAIQLLELMHSRQREPTPDKPEAEPSPPSRPTPAGVLARQLARRAVGTPHDVARSAIAGVSLAVRGLGRPDKAVGDAVDYARSLQRVLSPPHVDGSPLLKDRSHSWRFEVHDVELADLRTAAKAAGGSVNDAFIAALLGAFRRYHKHFGVEIDAMPVAMPISTRGGNDAKGGNKIAGARFAGPVGEPDPGERIRLVREFVLAARAEPAIDALSVVAPFVGRLPGPLLTRLGRSGTAANDLQASSVPGIRHGVYIAGAKVTHMYPFGPLPGCAAMVTMVSHEGTCCIGANVDRAAITDTDLFARCLREGFDEVLALAPRPTTPDQGEHGMTELTESQLTGRRGRIAVSQWRGEEPRYIALIAHGYGEHIGRYDHVARRLVDDGAIVYGPDHIGHGKSEGDRVLVEKVDDVVSDLRSVAQQAQAEHPDLPLVLIGHSMGGIIATRYAQRYPGELAALVLSAPVIGGNPGFEALLAMDPIPEVPIDPETLSRDPAVGEAYAADPLVWHGAFKRETLEAMFRAIEQIAQGPALGSLPTLWIHGEEDQLAPLELSREAVNRIRGDRLEERVYEGARHEIFNEINNDEVLGDVTAFLERTLAPARA
jgi:WS/DGAT/MGAT family acyltransferase